MRYNTIRDAVCAGCRSIILRNGTEIIHLDHGQNETTICPPKVKKNGEKVYRWLCVRVLHPNGEANIKNKEILMKYVMDDYHKWDFIIPERKLNLFINLNGGIDTYKTDYWHTGWMYY